MSKGKIKTNPLISIITVSYNAVSTIEKTILSVVNQTYPNIEYIIIDGGSTDGTVDVIRKYLDKIAYWVSEPDKGIYDAMNKGIAKATGKWINFMNAGDMFYSDNVVYSIFKSDEFHEFAVLYGKTEFVYTSHKKIVGKKNGKFYKIMPACHQSIFCLTKEMKGYSFDLNFKIAADFDFFYFLYKKGALYKYLDVIVASYEASMGLSSSNALECYKEVLQIMYPSNKLKYYLSFITFYLKRSANRFFELLGN